MSKNALQSKSAVLQTRAVFVRNARCLIIKVSCVIPCSIPPHRSTAHVRAHARRRIFFLPPFFSLREVPILHAKPSTSDRNTSPNFGHRKLREKTLDFYGDGPQGCAQERFLLILKLRFLCRKFANQQSRENFFLQHRGGSCL